VRTDLKLLGSRTATVAARQPCARCGRALVEAPPNLGGLPNGAAVPQFYVYPTGGRAGIQVLGRVVLASCLAGAAMTDCCWFGESEGLRRARRCAAA
jgi:hypothetical protein